MKPKWCRILLLITILPLLTPSTTQAQATRDALIQAIDWSPDGTKIATGGAGIPGRIWDAANWQLLTELQLSPELVERSSITLQIAWNPANDLIANLALNGIIIWDSQTGNPVSVIDSFITSNIAWSPDGNRIVYADGNGLLQIVDISQ